MTSAEALARAEELKNADIYEIAKYLTQLQSVSYIEGMNDLRTELTEAEPQGTN